MLKKILATLFAIGLTATTLTSGNMTTIKEEEHDYVHCHRCGEIIGEYEDETHEWYIIYGDTNYIIPTENGYVPVCADCF